MMKEKADLLIINSQILTMDPLNPRASNIAIKGNKIIEVGDFLTQEYIDKNTKIIDGDQKTVIPGFIDSHVHLFGGSAELSCLNVGDIQGIESLKRAVRDESVRNTNDKLLYAVCAGYNILGEGKEVTRHALDEVCPDRPFAMMAADHHTVWANTKALELGGILNGAPTDVGAEIVMGADGQANGVLLETSAFQYVVRHTKHGGRDFLGYITGDNPDPPATQNQRHLDKIALKSGLEYCAQFGITSVHNMDGNLYQMELLNEIEKENCLTCRVQVPCHFRNTHPLTKLKEAFEMQKLYNSSKLYSGRVKMFMDGVIDSYTALMVEPYPDRPDTFGDAVFSAKHFSEVATEADKMGLQISVHCCGDGAVRRTLDGYEVAQKNNGIRDSRHRIEHIETITDEDLPRFKELGVVASMQPLHSPIGGLFPAMQEGIIFSEKQIKNAYPWQSFRDLEVPLAFSTDWPVVGLNPMETLAGAVFPKIPDKRWKDQSQGLIEAISSYTAVGAYAEFAENRKGMVRAGMYADIVLLSENLQDADRDCLKDTQVMLTICDGEVVFSR